MGHPPAPAPPPDDVGTSLTELLVALGVLTVVLSLALPITAGALDEWRVRQAAQFVAARLRSARHLAVARAASTAVVFDRTTGPWTFRTCIDGNRDGVRRADIERGRDRCADGPYDLSTLFAGVALTAASSVPGLDGEGAAEAVKFGLSHMASFSATGTGTSGSVIAMSARGTHYAVRVAGVTGRTRLLRFDAGGRRWVDQ